MGWRLFRVRWTALALCGLAALATQSCQSDRRRSHHRGDSTSAGGGGGAGGSTSVPGGPQIMSLEAIPAVVNEGESFEVVATVTDPDGLADIVGGMLTDADQTTTYGPFSSLGGGTWSFNVGGSQLPPAGTVLVLRAAFTDTTNKVGVATISVSIVDPCQQACNELFDCGLANQNCPGFVESERNLFLEGSSTSDGCIANCEGSPLLLNFVDPSDCSGTTQNLSDASPVFACTCLEGVSSPNCDPIP